MLGICEKKNPTQTFIFEMYQIVKEIYIPSLLPIIICLLSIYVSEYMYLSSMYQCINVLIYTIFYISINLSCYLSLAYICMHIYHVSSHPFKKKESKSAMYQPLCQEEKCRHQNIQISDGGGLTLIIPEVLIME